MKLITQNTSKIHQDLTWKITTLSKNGDAGKNTTPLFKKHVSNDPET